jgi:hypothetical protein
MPNLTLSNQEMLVIKLAIQKYTLLEITKEEQDICEEIIFVIEDYEAKGE